MTGPELDTLADKIADRISAPTRWLKLKSASKYASIGQKDLIQLALDKEIDGFKDLRLKTKPWIFDKNSIDKYRAKQVEEFNDTSDHEKIALDIVESLDI